MSRIIVFASYYQQKKDSVWRLSGTQAGGELSKIIEHVNDMRLSGQNHPFAIVSGPPKVFPGLLYNLDRRRALGDGYQLISLATPVILRRTQWGGLDEADGEWRRFPFLKTACHVCGKLAVHGLKLLHTNKVVHNHYPCVLYHGEGK